MRKLGSKLTKLTRRKFLEAYGKRVVVEDDGRVLRVLDTGKEIGYFPSSDIVLLFTDAVSESPRIVTERPHRNNYSKLEWMRLRRRVMKAVEEIDEVNGYSVRVSFGRHAIDVMYSKQEWWSWLHEVYS